MPENSLGSVRARLTVWFSRVSLTRNAAASRLEHLQPAGVVLLQRVVGGADQVQRRALRAALLGEQHRAAREVESREAPGAGGWARRAAASATGPRSSGG